MRDDKCRSCKHWDKDFSIGLDGSRYDVVPGEVDTQVGSHRICLAIKLCDPHPISIGEEAPPAYTRDASGFMADLWTAPDFSCALWNQRAD